MLERPLRISKLSFRYLGLSAVFAGVVLSVAHLLRMRTQVAPARTVASTQTYKDLRQVPHGRHQRIPLRSIWLHDSLLQRAASA
ncbi:hypothetical protein K491DRAFT_26807 [Lophiostoma macrostomum CBS 122681]|uniref:Uncharacterized protein n=1 Tax=Lophiostoma macrostomum CBS 122681 TaxID=1314788 RepID=A0A6A6T2Y9_9PLEO|nr:hypothetical protein K491DRAFT_26807 [Lophiostoma macrostomum CBS 122681]